MTNKPTPEELDEMARLMAALERRDESDPLVQRYREWQNQRKISQLVESIDSGGVH